MSGHIEIATALNARMTAAAPGCAITASLIKNENAAFTPPASGLWYERFFLPGEPEASGIGAFARNRHVGIYQINVCGPAGSMTKATDDEAERIRKCYARGTALTYSGVIVTIEKCWVIRNPDSTAVPWYRQIVRVQWSADIEN